MKTLPISFFDRQPKSNEPVWGINTAHESEHKIMGEILINISKPNGGSPDPLRVPQTWLPQQLNTVITRRRLIEAPEFRNAVAEGLVSLISEEDAQKLLRQPGAKEEKDRLRALAQAIKTAGQAKTAAQSGSTIARADGVKDDDDTGNGLNDTVVMDYDDDSQEESVADMAARGLEDTEDGISPQFKMWADRLMTQKNDVLARNDVRSRGSFKPRELAYLSKHLPRALAMTLAMVNRNLEKHKTKAKSKK